MDSFSHHTLNLLTKPRITECKPYESPSSLKPVTPENLTPLANPDSYTSLVHSLQYLTVTSQKISFALTTICQHMHAPLECHLTPVKQILHYIKTPLAHGLTFSKSSLTLSSFSNAD